MGRRRAGARAAIRLRASLILALVLASCTPRPPKKEPDPAVNPGARILQFYARDPVLPRGEKSVLCYGVDNAKTVRIEPAVDRVWPTLSRCIEIAPTQSTTYTLTAEGADGKPVAQSVTVSVGAALPKIIEVSVNKLEVQSGEEVTICYHVKNAASVKVSPGHPMPMQLTTPEHGCYSDRPAKATAYTVIASSSQGVTDVERVTVKVKGAAADKR